MIKTWEPNKTKTKTKTKKPRDLESVILSEIRQREISFGIPYMENLKRNDTNELIYETEKDRLRE